MDGRRGKSKAKAPPYVTTTGNFNNNKSAGAKKPLPKGKKGTLNQALAEADQIMIDLIKGAASSHRQSEVSGSNQ